MRGRGSLTPQPRLPERATPALSDINAAGMAAMRFREGPGEPPLVRRHRAHVTMVRHEANRPNPGLGTRAPFREQRKVSPVVIVAEKDPLSAVSTLREVMRHAGNNKLLQPSHGPLPVTLPPGLWKV